MIYLVSTPIGNLKDITFRAIETLKQSDYILCEDTRHSLILLKHYDIHKPLKSYHQFNEASQLKKIIDDLKEGKQISLISDAGTPGISDPGALLVKECVAYDIPVVAIPGPCAAIHAISCSGLPTDQFHFRGFLPRKEGELKEALYEILVSPFTTICYESPHRLIDVLTMIKKMEPDRQLVVARELTKQFEEFKRGNAEQLLLHWEKNPLKGEIVLLFSPCEKKKKGSWEEMTPVEHVESIMATYGLSKQESIKIVAEIRDLPKRQVYKDMHQ